MQGGTADNTYYSSLTEQNLSRAFFMKGMTSMIKDGIVKIVNKQDLSYDEAYTIMNEIMRKQTGPEL